MSYLDESIWVVHHTGEQWELLGSEIDVLGGYYFNELPIPTELIFKVATIGDSSRLCIDGIYNTNTGKDLPWDKCLHYARTVGLSIPNRN